jgi:hypothetical protein
MRSFISFTLHQILMRLIKSSMIRYEERVAHIHDVMNAYKIFTNPERCRLKTTKFSVHVLMNIIIIHLIS